jgi:hypothetical protein
MTDIQKRVYDIIDKWENDDIVLSLAELKPILAMLTLWGRVNELYHKEHKALDNRDMQEAFSLSEQRRNVMIEILSYEIMIDRNLSTENQ